MAERNPRSCRSRCFPSDGPCGKVNITLTGSVSFGVISTANPDEFVTIKQTARFLGVWCNTLRGWDRDKQDQ